MGDQTHRQVCEVEFKYAIWQDKHWRTLQHSYGKCAHFARYRAFFEDVYRGQRWTHLSELNQFLIRHIAGDFLAIETEFQDSRSYAFTGLKAARLIDLLRHANTGLYLSARVRQHATNPSCFSMPRSMKSMTWRQEKNFV